QHGHGGLPAADLGERLREDARAAPLDAGEDGAVERGGAAADEVVAAVAGGAEDPVARLEELDGVVDELAREKRLVDADGDDLLRPLKEESLGEGHAEAVAEGVAGLNRQRGAVEGAPQRVAAGGFGRCPAD